MADYKQRVPKLIWESADQQNEPLKPYAATRVSFGGNLHGQLLFAKTNVHFGESYKFKLMYSSLNMSTNIERR